MRFAELTPGRVIDCGTASLSDEQIMAFGREYDPQWIHTDRERAAASSWKGLIASGWQTCGVAMRLACERIFAGSESIGSPGLAYLKWETPVRAGDELRLIVEILERRVARSNAALGVLRARWRLINQHGETTLDFEATSLFALEGALPNAS